MTNPYSHVGYNGYESFRNDPNLKNTRKGSITTAILTLNNNNTSPNIGNNSTNIGIINNVNNNMPHKYNTSHSNNINDAHLKNQSYSNGNYGNNIYRNNINNQYYSSNHHMNYSHSSSHGNNGNNNNNNNKYSNNNSNNINNYGYTHTQYNHTNISHVNETTTDEDYDDDDNIHQKNTSVVINGNGHDSESSEDSVTNIKSVYDDDYGNRRSTITVPGASNVVIHYEPVQFSPHALKQRYSSNNNQKQIITNNVVNINNVSINNIKKTKKYNNTTNKPPPPPGPPPRDIIQRYSAKGYNITNKPSESNSISNSDIINNNQPHMNITVTQDNVNDDHKSNNSNTNKNKKPQTPSKSLEPSETMDRIDDMDLAAMEQDRNYRPSIVTGLNHSDEMFKVSIDRYGFPTENEIDEKQHRKMIRKEQERLLKWQNMLFPNKKGKMFELSGVNPFDAQIAQWDLVKNHRKLKSRIRKGIPQQLRSLVWQNLCGSRERRKLECERYKNSKLLYQDLVQKKKSPYHEQLWKDINRTYRHQIRFGGVGIELKKKLGKKKQQKIKINTNNNNNNNNNNNSLQPTNENEPKIIEIGKNKIQKGISGPQELSQNATEAQQALYNVLKAMSLYRTDIGYCQGMQAITALLLMHMTEEEAFWVLASLADDVRYQMEFLWRPSMPAIQLRFYQMERFVRIVLPKLAAHFEKHQIISASMYQASQWFITVFLATELKFETVIRIWDIYLSEGLKTIYRMGLGILKYFEKELLKTDFEGMLKIFRNGPSTIDTEKYIETCFSFKITHAQLQAFERDFNRQQNGNKKFK